MNILAILSQKGGSGKTTITINLAVAAALEGKQVIVIDLDPQSSTAAWSNLRSEEMPVIVPGTASHLPGMIERAKKAGADLILIDTAPKDEEVCLLAAKLADFIVIPCKPSNLDLHAVGQTVKLVKKTSIPACFVLNDCKATTSLNAMAIDALNAYPIEVAPVQLGSRVDFVKSLMEGKGVLEYRKTEKAAREVAKLYKFIKSKLEKGK